MRGTIYALADPGSGEIRYIGQTIVRPSIRLEGHRHSGTKRVSEWIRSLVDRGEQPMLIELETGVDAQDLDALEREYIGRHASPSLLNVVHNPHAIAERHVRLDCGDSPNNPLPVTKFRRMLGSVIEQFHSGEPVFISDHGHPVMVLISIADYRRLTAFRDNQPGA